MTPRPPKFGKVVPMWPDAAPQPAAMPREPEAAASTPAPDAAPLVGADVLQCPAALLGKMPVAVSLMCVSGDGVQFLVTTSRAAYEHARADGWPVFVGGELTDMATGAGHDRVWAPQLGEWLARKAAEPGWRLTLADAVGGGEINTVGYFWTIGQVFERLGVKLLGVRMEG